MAPSIESDFPCAITIRIPFPTHRLAETALRALAVDEELSPLVRRSFSLASVSEPGLAPSGTSYEPVPPANEFKPSPRTGGALRLAPDHPDMEKVRREMEASRQDGGVQEENIVLVTKYRATTNRMLRVAVNGFFESVGVVITTMKELDVDVANEDWVGDGEEDIDELRRVQGLEEGGTLGT